MRALAACLFLVPPAGKGAAALPAGFTDTRLGTLPLPTGLALTPDGRLLVTTQPGLLRVHDGAALLPTPALDLSAVTCANSERGLLGLALDPGFPGNPYLYLYYTFNRSGGCPTGLANPTPVNRISRFTLPPSNVVDPGSEVVLVDGIPSVNGYHNAGGLVFGADGLLYAGVGDSGIGERARTLDTLSGKLLRVGADGRPAPGNPFTAHPAARRCGDPAGLPAGTGPCAEVFAYGLRNPFRLVARPGSSELYVHDVGSDRFEEVNLAGAGANYGWPVREGPCSATQPPSCAPTPAGFTDPLFAYDHGGGCASIAGGAFPTGGVWPDPFEGSLLFADWGCGTVFRLAGDGQNGYTAIEFASGYGRASLVDAAFGRIGSRVGLVIADMEGGGPAGQLRLIEWTPGANRPPGAALLANPDWGPAPLLVNLDASGSADPDLDPLTYDWDFGDSTGQSGGSSPTTTHSYAASGVYTASVVARDGRGGASTPASLRIDVGNTPPRPSILAPTLGQRFRVDESLTLVGAASDVEDGALPGSSLSFRVRIHHVPEGLPAGEHIHAYLPWSTGNNLPLVGPAAEDLAATRLSWLEIELRATDSLGREGLATQRFEPNRVDLVFETLPGGLELLVAGARHGGARSLVSWEGLPIPVAAPIQMDGAGVVRELASWSDGGAASHTVATPALATTYVASFRDWPDPLGRLYLLRNDEIAILDAAPARRAGIFTGFPGGPSLDLLGVDRLGEAGEGFQRAANGSADDDDLYLDGIAGPSIEPESALLGDVSRPLVFYQLDRGSAILQLVKVGGGVGLVPRQ